jgi:hypothetical protein
MITASRVPWMVGASNCPQEEFVSTYVKPVASRIGFGSCLHTLRYPEQSTRNPSRATRIGPPIICMYMYACVHMLRASMRNRPKRCSLAGSALGACRWVRWEVGNQQPKLRSRTPPSVIVTEARDAHLLQACTQHQRLPIHFKRIKRRSRGNGGT